MSKRCYIGIDLGGTLTKIAVGDAEGRILADRRFETNSRREPRAVLERVGEEALAACADAGVEPDALGIGLAGVLDIRLGLTKHLPNFLTHWPDVPVAELLGRKVGCPVHILNDVQTATLGELTFGLGRSVKTMIFLALGTGIGGGVVVDGRLHLGSLGSAGEMGHTIIDPDGAPCGCGGRGCLETVASGTALAGEGVRLLRAGQAPLLFEIVEGDAGRVDARAMCRAAERGEESIRRAIERAAFYLAIAISNVAIALQPELVVIGGGVAGLGDLLFEPLRRTVRERIHIFPAERLRIEPSALGESAGAMGAIALAHRGGALDLI